MRFAVLMLYFNAERTILEAITNCAPFVDKIYISYSKYPWNQYNLNARDQYNNQSSLLVIETSAFREKITIIDGVWDTEEDQRNEVVTMAKEEGFDYLIIQDPDEFYTPEGYRLNLDTIRQNPGYFAYQTRWINFWKDLKHIILWRNNGQEKNTIYAYCPCFAVNLHKDIHFTSRRYSPYLSNYDHTLVIDGLCYHLSWVYTDEDLLMKISTWGHSYQVTYNWYRWSWLAWTPSLRNFNPLNGPLWLKAVPFNGPLPKELNTLAIPQNSYQPLGLMDQIKRYVYGVYQLVKYYFTILKTNMIKIKRHRPLF